jgi:UDP-N-acetylglucosamine 2-epimerase (non-hydrolysing)
MKLMTVLGTRPEIIRLSRVIAALDRHMDHVLVHTGQNYDYELNQIFFDDLELRAPDHFLDAHGDTPAETVAQVISKVDRVMAEVNPEAVLILGDTNSCLASYPAKRRKIPVFHMEAGNRCFDERVPEEINRRIVDHISDINMPYSDISREYLLREGLPPDRVIKTGSPMMEVIRHYMPKIEASGVLGELKLTDRDYFLVSCHREENVDSENFARFASLLGELAGKFKKRIVVSTHPRTRKKIEALGKAAFSDLVEFMKPFCFSDYVHLQLHAKAVLSDSGTISEEASILNFPALNLRDAHERPEAMEEAVVVMTGMDATRVMQGLEILLKAPRGDERLMPVVRDYDVPVVSEKVVRIVVGHVNYVNGNVWKYYNKR